MEHSRATLHCGTPCFNCRVEVTSDGAALKAAGDARNVPVRLETRHERPPEKTGAARDQIGLLARGSAE